MSNLRIRIQEELDKRGLTPTSLAEKCGVPQPTIQRFLSGQHGEPRSATIKKIASGLGLTEAQLRFGDFDSNTEPAPIMRTYTQVPVVGKAQLGDNGHWTEIDMLVGHGDGYVNYPTSDPNAYALRCVGDSMRPRIKDGEFVVIEPNAEPIPGDEVLVKAKDGRVMVKVMLYKRDGKLHLISINENHPPQSIPLDEIEKIHPVVGIMKKAVWLKGD